MVGRSGGVKAQGKLSVPGRPTNLDIKGQGSFAIAVCAGGVGLDIFFSRLSFLFPSPSLGDGPI